jgi:hypothetical protein
MLNILLHFLGISFNPNFSKTDKQDKEVIQLAVAAYAAWILERTKQTLNKAGATSEATAKTPNELNLDERWLKMSANTIIPSGVVATQDRRYYIRS